MSISLQAVRDAIVATLETVADIGVVHGYEPLAKSMQDLRAYYQSRGLQQLRGWYVRRISTQEVGEIFERGVEYATWRIQGYVAVSDAGASEIETQELVESIRQAFREDRDLGGAVASQSAPSRGGEIGIQVREISTVMFCDVLCHAIRLELGTERFLPVEEP